MARVADNFSQGCGGKLLLGSQVLGDSLLLTEHCDVSSVKEEMGSGDCTLKVAVDSSCSTKLGEQNWVLCFVFWFLAQAAADEAMVGWGRV